MAQQNPNSRLEAFADGVFAIAITLLVIELKVPHVSGINATADLWAELQHMLPAIFAFVLSFGTILITWVNHHSAMKLVDKSSHAFIYANGFLLLIVASMPFPTALLGEYLFTDYASPAVVLYAAVNGLQALSWIFVGFTATKARPVPLTKNDKATAKMHDSYLKGYYGLSLYALMAVAAFWYPMIVTAAITILWIGWVIVGINIKDEG